MDDEYVDVLDASYDILENDLDEQIAARDVIPLETREAREEQYQALRARYQRPEPRPRQRRLDTFKGEQWNDWCDGRIAAVLQKRERAYDKAVGRALGQATAKLQTEIATLRRELKDARTEIKRLQSRDAADSSIVSWYLERQRFRVTPFYGNGKPGPTLDLRALFEEYHVQTS
jgi:hypothetical protein